jgi:hypothetical protein
MKFRTYLFELILWMFLPSIGGWILFEIFSEYRFDSYPVIPAGMIVLGTIFYFILKKVPYMSESKKILLYYLNVAIKMSLSLTLILFVTLQDRTNALFFIITFFVFYIFLTVFEVRCFIKIAKLMPGK